MKVEYSNTASHNQWPPSFLDLTQGSFLYEQLSQQELSEDMQWSGFHPVNPTLKC